MMSRGRNGNFSIEACLRDALGSLGEGWDLEVIEALIDQYKVDFSEVTESSISSIECGLREMLGSAADIFIDNFYTELRRAGCPLMLV